MTLIEKLEKSEPLTSIYEEIEHTEDFKGCLIVALKNYPKEKELRELLLSFTEDHTGCLSAALTVVGIENSFLELLFPLTKDFAGCLINALASCPHDTGLLKRLVPLTEDFTDCLHTAISSVVDEDFLWFLVSKTESIDGVVKKANKSQEAMQRLVRVLKRGDTSHLDYGHSLRYSIATSFPNREGIDFFLEKTNTYEFCLRNLLYYHPGEVDLVTVFKAQTVDFEDCLFFAAPNLTNPDPLIAELVEVTTDLKKVLDRVLEHRPNVVPVVIEEMLKRKNTTEGILKKVLTNKSVSDDTIITLLKAESSFDGVLKEAVIGRPGRVDIVSMIFALSGFKKAAGVGDKERSWLPYHLQEMFLIPTITNNECMVCLDTFEEGETEKTLVCGHRIHSWCDVATFDCRMH